MQGDNWQAVPVSAQEHPSLSADKTGGKKIECCCIKSGSDSSRFKGVPGRRHRMKIPQEADYKMNAADTEGTDYENQEELEEKTRLINQVLELQHTLEDLSARVDAVKEENLKLKSENQVLGQYIENLMSASSVFQTTDSKNKRK
ncbi:short coiled-coil protein B-like [Chiloscyllium punctatum]|uniref:short coiled-coil protein B-like n=1 Tax=Chiloscyllium punctatum TaxID=137246 RepID=UPI003B640E7F